MFDSTGIPIDDPRLVAGPDDENPAALTPFEVPELPAIRSWQPKLARRCATI